MGISRETVLQKFISSEWFAVTIWSFAGRSDQTMLGTIQGRYGTPRNTRTLFACRNVSTWSISPIPFHSEWELKSTGLPQIAHETHPFLKVFRQFMHVYIIKPERKLLPTKQTVAFTIYEKNNIYTDIYICMLYTICAYYNFMFLQF